MKWHYRMPWVLLWILTVLLCVAGGAYITWHAFTNYYFGW